MKRIIDIFFAILGMFFLSPLFLLLPILIKSTSKGSVFFIQERVGRKGKIFKMIKFRTMHAIQDSNSTISIKGDSRITKVGVFLRRYKLDELPELMNVFLGQMSLVGPRPDVPGYADKLFGNNRNILKLRPGITGLASLKYSNEEALLAQQKDPKSYNDQVIYPDKVRINLDYYYNQTVWLDIKIIFATIFKLISERG
ncbi:MAG: sugar transferase [Flavobacteriales bacterium]|nr:sugar transferase [Flavobacteriales bacterium]|tara:strand:+ start:61891 stop:62484 length:594 start_codon:yes stop_codon:yes gene_type:complete